MSLALATDDRSQAADAAARLHGLPPARLARVALAYAQPALDALAEAGLAPAGLGLDPPLSTPLPDPLPALHYMALLEAAAAQGAGEDLGLRVGARMRTASFVAYGHVVLSSPDFGAAMAQTRRYEGLAHDLGRSELQVEDGQAHYLWHCPWLLRQPGRQVCESVMAGIFVFVRWLAQRPLPLQALAFPHPAPSPAARARLDDFFGVKVQFGAPVTRACFDARLLAEPIPSADASLLPLLQQHAEALLSARQTGLHGLNGLSPSGVSPPVEPLGEQVRRQIAERLAQDGARMAEVAQALGLSPRTLQRRLAALGTPFQALLDGVRRELAQRYVADPALSLTEIAFLLGYAEQSSFTHAFKAWFGQPPQAVRRRG